MQRRRTLAVLGSAAAATLAATWQPGSASADGGDREYAGRTGQAGLDRALQAYQALPGTKSYLIHAGSSGSRGVVAHQPDLRLFTASAYKTFLLGQFLRDVEAGRLSEDAQLGIDDSVRMYSSPVFFELAGKTQARSVLDAMIAYSDNTATDLATRTVGADRVRDLIARLGLASIRIPASTRIFFSYLLGAPAGVDYGWPGITAAAQNATGPFRPPLNDVITLAGSARDFVAWYENALQGDLFAQPATLREFQRIQAQSVQIPLAVPAETVAYAKGGEFPANLGFPLNAKSFAGQMVVTSGRGAEIPVTFCFALNWNAPSTGFPAVEAAFFAAIKGILASIKRALA